MLGAEELPRRSGLARSSGVVVLWAAVIGVLAAVVLIAGAVTGELDTAQPWRSQASGGDWGTLEGLGAYGGPEGSLDAEADDQLVRLAGSGSNLPLTREIAEAFTRRWPSKRVIVFESVGSTGGIRAVSDGVVDLGLVSRPFRPAEDGLGLVVIPYARVAVAAVANLDVPDQGLSQRGLIDVFAGERRRWANDAPIVVLQRERGDSSHATVDRVLPEFAAVNDAAYRQERWRVVYNDRAMYEALVSTPGAIGLLDVGATQTQALALKVLELDGVAPTEANLRSGRYPFAKDLSFVSVEQPAGLAKELVDFVRSSDGQALIRQRGYIPLTGAPPRTNQADQADPANQADQPNQADQTDPTDPTNQGNQGDQGNQADQTDQADQADQADQTDQTDQPSRADQADQPDQADQSDQTDQERAP